MLYKISGRHSSVVLSVPTILRPRVRIPSSPSMLFFNLYRWNCIWNEKRTKINKKRPGLAHIWKRLVTGYTDSRLFNLIVVISDDDLEALGERLMCTMGRGQHVRRRDQRPPAEGLRPDPGPDQSHLEGDWMRSNRLTSNHSGVGEVGSSAWPQSGGWNRLLNGSFPASFFFSSFQYSWSGVKVH